MSGKPIKDGKVGDKYDIQSGYEGKWDNAIGKPHNPSGGSSVPLPPGTVGSDTVVVERPDFRTIDSQSQVFPK